MNHRVGKAAALVAPRTSPPCTGGMIEISSPGEELEISIDEFHACPNQDALVKLSKFRFGARRVAQASRGQWPIRYMTSNWRIQPGRAVARRIVLGLSSVHVIPSGVEESVATGYR